MVRSLFLLARLHHHSHTMTLIFASLAMFAVLSVLALLCASHRDKIKQFKFHKSLAYKSSSNGQRKRLFPGFSDNIGVSGKALLKMVSWQRVGNEEEVVESVDDDQDVVWRKTIIMGEKCRPLDYSGRIKYDCEGNPLSLDDDKNEQKDVLFMHK